MLQVPFVPFTPALSIFINIYLMFFFDIYTWTKFIIWMIIGWYLLYLKDYKILDLQLIDLN